MRHSNYIHIRGEVYGGLREEGKFVTLCGRDICLCASCETFVVFKSLFYRNCSKFLACVRPRHHGYFNMMRNWVATLHAITTLNKCLQDKVDIIPHKSRILPSSLRIAKLMLPRGTKWKGSLAIINQVKVVLFLVYLHVLWFCQVHFQLIHRNYLGYLVGQRH